MYRASPFTIDARYRDGDGRKDSIEGLEGYNRMLSPCPSRKNVKLDANGFVSQVNHVNRYRLFYFMVIFSSASCSQVTGTDENVIVLYTFKAET
jgi:hypothetical protein